MIYAYNPEHVGRYTTGDCCRFKGQPVTYERKYNITQIKNSDGTIVGWNFFQLSDILTLEAGQVYPTKEQIAILEPIASIVRF